MSASVPWIVIDELPLLPPGIDSPVVCDSVSVPLLTDSKICKREFAGARSLTVTVRSSSQPSWASIRSRDVATWQSTLVLAS